MELPFLQVAQGPRALREARWRGVDGRALERYVERRKLPLSKYMRKAAWRLMIRFMPRKVARFVQLGFGELKVSEARYKDLLAEADEYYPKYLEQLRGLVQGLGSS